MIFLTIPGPPLSKKRPRFARRGRFTHTYDPQCNEKHEIEFILHNELILQADFNETTFNELIKTLEAQEIAVKAIYMLPIPKSDSKSKRMTKSAGLTPHTKKPDLDNLLKWTLDCGNGILWPDDAIITQISCQKIYSEEPCTILEISP